MRSKIAERTRNLDPRRSGKILRFLKQIKEDTALEMILRHKDTRRVVTTPENQDGNINL